MRCLASFLLFYTIEASFHEEELYGPIGPPTTQQPNRPLQTRYPIKRAASRNPRSLSGTMATDGNLAYNDELYEIMTLWILKGFAIFKIKQYNDRVYLDRTRRSYWYGDRYYRLVNIAQTTISVVYRIIYTIWTPGTLVLIKWMKHRGGISPMRMDSPYSTSSTSELSFLSSLLFRLGVSDMWNTVVV